MKKLTSILIIILTIFNLSYSQGVFEYNLTVTNNRHQAIDNLQITLKETKSGKTINKQTDRDGKVSFTLNEGNIWKLSIGKMINYDELEMPPNGKTIKSDQIPYDLENWRIENRNLPDRRKIAFKTIKQGSETELRPTKTKSLLQLKLIREDKSVLKNYPVSVTSLSDKIIYKAKTDNQGIADFLLPHGKEYEVDIDGIESYRAYSISGSPGTFQYRIVYEPTKIYEKNINDTINQRLEKNARPTSSRYLFKIILVNSAGQILENENVYFDRLKSKDVYTAKTNSLGEATFLLPIKSKYMIHFDFQKDVDVLNLSKIRGLGYGEMKIVYNPNPQLQYPEKYIPTAEELLVEEFNNFVEQQLPPPPGNKGVQLIYQWGNELVNKQSKEAILQIGISVSDKKIRYSSAPINISFVVDKSGSMAGNERIETLKTSLINFVKLLNDDDIVSLIAFSNDYELLIKSGKIKGNKDDFIAVVEMIEAGGGTNIYKGMVAGYEQVLQNMITKGTNRVVLLTDGYGKTPVDVITKKSKEYNDKGVELSAVGVGYGYNQALLIQLSTIGNGLFKHAGSSADIEKSFNAEISNLLFPVLKDMKIEIEYNNKIVFKQLYGFPFKKQSDNKVKLAVDNVYPGMNRITILEFTLNAANKSIEQKPVIVKTEYFDLRLNKKVNTEEKLFLKWSKETGKTELIVEREQKKLYAIAVMNQSLKVMSDAFEINDFAKAEETVQNAIAQIEELYPDAKQEDVENLYKKLRNYSQIITQYKKNLLRRE